MTRKEATAFRMCLLIFIHVSAPQEVSTRFA